MKTITMHKWSGVVLTVILVAVLFPARMSSHCDTMNGPVVTAATEALETGNVNLVFIWVQKKHEAEIADAFQKTLIVRKLNREAQRLADMYFFETLVRIHRAGEGVAYAGLKPAEQEVDPGIAAADNALETGSLDQLIQHVDEAIRHGVKEQHVQAMAKKRFTPDDVGAGREYVEAYVQFIHYVERLYRAAVRPAAGHFHEETEEVGVPHEEH